MRVHMPVQKALFNAVTQRFSNQSSAIRDYLKQFPGCAESTARSRFNNTIAIEYEHGMRVAAHYGLHDLHIWPEGWPETHFLIETSSMEPDIDAYLCMLNHDLLRVRRTEEAKTYLTINEMPLFLLKKYRMLAAFLLYYTFVIDCRMPKLKNIAFGTTFLSHPSIQKWLDNCRDALHNYQHIEGVEYWSPFMFNHILAKLRAADRIGSFENNSYYTQIQNDVHSLIGDMENMTAAGQKLIGPEKEGASVRIFNHDGLLNDTSMVVQSRAVHLAYVEHGLLNLHRYCSKLADQYLNRIESHSDLCSELGRRPHSTTRFFDQLKRNVDMQCSV